MPDVVAVVGGGITGLVAARTLRRQELGRVVLFEAADRLGGKIRTESWEGTIVETGPDSFLAREPDGVRLCGELGLRDDLVAPAAFGAHVWIDDRLKPIPSGFTFGFPSDPVALVRSGLLSAPGAARALAEVLLPGPLSGPDLSIGEFVRRRFGKQLLERLVDPLLAGTRSGRADELSLAAALPQIDALARSHRSVLLGLMRAQKKDAASGGVPPFLAPRQGMQHIVKRLHAELVASGVDIRTGAKVRAITSAGGAYIVRTSTEDLDVAGVAVTTPAFVAADLLAELNPAAAVELRGIPYASVAVVHLLFPRDAGRLPEQGSGILVPGSEERTIAGCTWTARKWSHASPADGRIPVRCFIGRSSDDPVLRHDDAELAARAAHEIQRALGWTRAPLSVRVTRWPHAIAQYTVGHNQRIERIERALGTTPGLALAGAAYRGAGIPDCVRAGEDAARRVAARAHVRPLG